MRILGRVSGSINRDDVSTWLWPPFHLAVTGVSIGASDVMRRTAAASDTSLRRTAAGDSQVLRRTQGAADTVLRK